MSVDYYMVCPECKEYAQIFRFTAGGNNPPNGYKVQDFWIEHHGHNGFEPIVHEQAKLMDQTIDEKWAQRDTYGEGTTYNPTVNLNDD